MIRKLDRLRKLGLSFFVDKIEGGKPGEEEIGDALEIYAILRLRQTAGNAAKPAFQRQVKDGAIANATEIILEGFSDYAQTELRLENDVYDMFEAADNFFYEDDNLDTFQAQMRKYMSLKLRNQGVTMYLSKSNSLAQDVKAADPMNVGVSALPHFLNIITGVKKKYPLLAKELMDELKKTQKQVPPAIPKWRWLRTTCLLAEEDAKREENKDDSESDDDVDEPEEKASAQVTKMSARARDAEIIKQGIEQGIAQGIKIALAMESSKQPYAGGGRGGRGGRGDEKCDHCGKPNHTEDRCWSKHPEMKPAWARRHGDR